MCSATTKQTLQAPQVYLIHPQAAPGLYGSLEPIVGTISALKELMASPNLNISILSAQSVRNPHSYSEKRIWVGNHLGEHVADRLILSNYKGLNRGDYLIDHYGHGKGQEYFEGALIPFGSARYPDWSSVVETFREHEVMLSNAESMFENKVIALEWLRSPIPRLGNRKPIQLIHSVDGKESINAILSKIESGDLIGQTNFQL